MTPLLLTGDSEPAFYLPVPLGGGGPSHKPKHEHIGDAVRPEWRVNK